MKFAVLLPVFLVMLALRRFNLNVLSWAFVWAIGCFVALKYGFVTPIPASVFNIYMALALGAIVIYIFSDAERLEEGFPLVFRQWSAGWG